MTWESFWHYSPLWMESTDHQWIHQRPVIWNVDVSAPDKVLEQTVGLTIIWGIMALIWRRSNVLRHTIYTKASILILPLLTHFQERFNNIPQRSILIKLWSLNKACVPKFLQIWILGISISHHYIVMWRRKEMMSNEDLQFFSQYNLTGFRRFF